MFQSKFLLLAICLVSVMLVIYFEIQVTQIENGKQKLELVVARLQVRELEQRRLAQARTGVPDSARNSVVIYNRVPKTGSTSFVGVAYDLCKQNGFRVLHINITGNMHALSLANQLRFAENVSHWDAIKPAFYHGHVAFVDFLKFGVNQPIYINIIRKPLDRLVSYYYFLRYGDDFRPHLIRRKHGDKMTFDECVELAQSDCDPNNMWLQIPFFCGHSADCWEVGNEWALSEAKRNLLEHYFLVGVTEELGDFIKVLEATLPSFFQGASVHYETSNKSHLRRTAQKLNPSPDTVARIQSSKVWKMENELYEYALKQFYHTKRRTLSVKDGGSVEKEQNFMYEKIRPK
ncbi:heparan sulfate 2-O-sulfotransferase 1 [Bacillus rossius redtenbacheri]|uniref:heparan sulfate 2-O-sulfotransferase 1 n=1 Tax=Bacillus rossius redtenbacheri TaxID=93214 RepID=UPI002FDEE7B2